MSDQSTFLFRDRALALLLLAFAASCAASPRQGARPASGSSVRSISLTVADLDASERFFVETLGFRVEAPASELRGAEFEGLTGIASAEAHSAHLALGREHIELVAFARPSGRPSPEDGHSDDLWFQHLALVASNIDSVHDRVQAAGANAISAGTQTIPASNPAAGGIRAFYFQGPSSHPLELIWFPAGKGMARWQDASAPVLGIDHTAIAVSNTERSRVFYEDLLGLHVAGHSFNFGKEQEALSGVPGARVRITGLRGEDGPGVEFLEYENPRRGRPVPTDARASDLWHWETTIAVPNLDATIAKLQAAVVHFVSDHVHDTRELGFSGTRGVVVLDPDGHAVRVVQ
jgi:catechol 2,3-dioxygenase-like lactoylglutathione lyase family enzyme